MSLRLAALASALVLAGPVAASPDHALPAWSTSAAGGFVSAHGERASVMGYPEGGLEVWAWPLQLLSGYRLRFHEEGRVAPLDAGPLLARVERRASETVRTYVGPDFVVREHLFAPLHEAGVVFTYEVEGRGRVRVEARFRPSLNLMWPAALGGQEVAWDPSRSGYVEREPLHRFNATVRSPEAVAHDPTNNAATGREDALAVVMQPQGPTDGVRRARLFVAADAPATGPDASANAPPLAVALEGRADALRAEADAHAADLLAASVNIETPDAELNRALLSAELALDQAWVCAPGLGCGEVGGYGPSRPRRRPQYAWFFAGDGLVAVEGLLASGGYERARDELAFIARYQDPKTGMIWHEMSLSAPLIDWARYPYMFAHVDITLQYLATLADYVDETGDRAFLREHWAGVQAAWRYARSLTDPATGLPRIPPGKQGQNEQAQLRDDLRLSSAWIDAADGFARLARAAERPALAAEGSRAACLARRSVGATGWDAERGFWLEGHTLSGAPVRELRSDAAHVLVQGAFTPAQVDSALDRLSRPDFQTDWGVRSLSSEAPGYDPNAYSAGSVWGLGTSATAAAFWAAHRPLVAWNAWHGLLAWSTQDSPGRMHEVTAGDLFHPEQESVPEQTWSSAGFLSAAVSGLLGLKPDAGARTLAFAPHLPGGWDGVTVRGVRVGASRVDLRLRRSPEGLELDVDDRGPPVAIDFAPELPLGARLLGARVDGADRPAALEPHPQDPHGRLHVEARTGATRVVVRFEGGVRIVPVEAPPQAGDPSRGLRIASAAWKDDALELHAFVSDPARASVYLVTPLRIASVKGAQVAAQAPGRYRLTLPPPAPTPAAPAYAPVEVRVAFAR